MSNATSCGPTSRRVIVVFVSGSVADVAAYAVTVLITALFGVFTASAKRYSEAWWNRRNSAAYPRPTADPSALIPVLAVKWDLEACGAVCPVERPALVAGHSGLHVGVAIEERVRFLGGDARGDEDATGPVLLAAGEQQAARLDLGLEELQVSRPGLLDDVGRLQVGRRQHMDHLRDTS